MLYITYHNYFNTESKLFYMTYIVMTKEEPGFSSLQFYSYDKKVITMKNATQFIEKLYACIQVAISENKRQILDLNEEMNWVAREIEIEQNDI